MLSYQQQHVAACSISVPSVPTPPARGGVGLTGDLTLALAASLRLGRGSTMLARHWSQFVSVLFQKFSGQRTRPWTVHWAEEVLDGGDATPPRPERGAAGWSSGRGGWGVRAGPCRGRVWLISECQLITFISNLYAEDSWHSIAGVTTFLRYPHITLYTGRVCGRSCCLPR